MITVSSTTLAKMEQTDTGYTGRTATRKHRNLRNIILMYNYVKGGSDTQVDIKVYSRSTLGGPRLPLQTEPVKLPAGAPAYYSMVEYPIRLTASQAGRIIFQVSDTETMFEVDLVNNAGADGTIQLEIGDA